MRSRSSVLGLVLALTTIPWPLIPLASSAQAAPLYQWTDSGGVVRYTPELERIPAAARPGVLVVRRDPVSGAIAAFRWGESEPLALTTAPAPAPPEIVATAPARVPAEIEPPAKTRPEPAAPRPVVERAPPTHREPPTEKLVTGDRAPPLYAIQLRATPLTAWLDPLERSGLLAGHRLYRVRAELESGRWERLRLGFYATHGEARAALTQLQASFPDAWIDRIDAAERSAAARAEIRPPGDVAAVTAPDAAGPQERRGYAIQLDAWPVDEDLRALTRLELLERQRLYRITAAVDGAVWERLRLGFFPKLEDARAVLRKLEPSFPGAFIASVGTDERIAFAGTTLARAR